ncbi:uncharacterized protein LOC120261293 [Dioscorea cayenensis subsp. rotundata]|uniref:SREBP regulating gene protein n=1 Tax=Dioscorea cayennensis subsp. rotundata TaxID=55577 RepID=A0AB40BCM9_DIOCR|nr:uncharacterized protein LOC120261293 [Dioscorea cayenensis subsp. rotundata]
MEKARSRFLLFLRTTLWILIVFGSPPRISCIRRDFYLPVQNACRSTVQGRFLISDDKGYVCTSLSVDPWTRCCPEAGEQFSCQGCNLVSRCCNSYEYCVSCCLNPSKTQEELAVKVKIAKQETAGTYSSVFDFCAGRCRHNSASVVHENAYASDSHHCFSLDSNSTRITRLNSPARLAGIDIVIGKQGESCESACKLKGISCVPSRLFVLNNCEYLQKYMSCNDTCLASTGADQPAKVVDDAPGHLNPGACLYTQIESMLSCDGSHQHTRRLCPCA